ncbi:HDOD domain-containing protein [Desulfofustis glycolicus]|uniref:HDIG domain-containing protein n=1 Tax=Desulfofustis glycolicus DSM 9705 TaxID=1121409 RepID=A0A1M5TIA9_9BACT|nr:HDOD domain-containing protein [Desulfofustis glycolicus]MCB2216423.1 HDOD domain-containing protein [Desulfobulbaceae bacterium]SHH50444.1 HDIG domain-containing protein [Desulfofustis glycolicus DSM 9705]
MPPDSGTHRKQIEKFITRMPSLSTTVGKVMEICSRVDASPNELNKVISLDPVLTGQVLKLINSAYYSLVNKVTSLTRAITMLGLNTVKNMALSTAIIKTVSGVKKSRVLPVSKFWAHSISVGVSAKLLAQAKDIPVMEREEFFIGGLLHDLGKIPFGDEYAEVIRLAGDEQVPLIDVEREVLGIDHQEVGLMIAEKWKLNEALLQCIGFHHDPQLAGEGARRQTAFIALGNIYSNIYDIGYAGDLYPSERALEHLLELTGLNWQEFVTIRADIETEIEKAQIFLQI